MHHLRNLMPGLTKWIADTKADVITLHQKLLYYDSAFKIM